MKWKKVSRKNFDEVFKTKKHTEAHTIMFCDPPITFYWDSEAKLDEDRSFGQGAFAKKVHNYLGEFSFPAEYYLLEAIK